MDYREVQDKFIISKEWSGHEIAVIIKYETMNLEYMHILPDELFGAEYSCIFSNEAGR